MANPTIQEVKLDLSAHLLSLAERLDWFVRPGAGAAMLGFQAESWRAVAGIEPSTLDISRFPAGEHLEEIFRYAFLGELCVPWIDDDEETGNLGPIKGLVARTQAWNKLDDFYEVICNEFAVRPGVLAKMANLAHARHELDTSPDVSLEVVALLAEIDIRSARNALLQPPPKGLTGSRNDTGEVRVSRSEALRWLRTDRRAFPMTVRIGSLATTELRVPDELQPDEVIPYLSARAKELAGDDLDMWIARKAERELFWSPSKLRDFLEGKAALTSPDEAAAMASALHLDSRWLMRQMGLDLSEQGVELVKEKPHSPFDHESGVLEVELTEAGIRNGYFDMEMRWAKQLFPADAFGDRDGNRHGIAVELRYDGRSDASDIREKSKNKASPRKRFHGFFGRHKATSGDRLRIQKVGERTYTLEILPALRVTHDDI